MDNSLLAVRDINHIYIVVDGKDIKPHDITMLRHENLELNLMKKYNMTYDVAHNLAESKYNYKKELDEFLERIGG